ncbi:MAG TPA: FG-GAP-like repeat-containing protein [Gemmatimonadaceae bacterium]|nr:FG-GAP-like repeat-containing protein [Gemmatimonadaceae bacterium]
MLTSRRRVEWRALALFLSLAETQPAVGRAQTSQPTPLQTGLRLSAAGSNDSAVAVLEALATAGGPATPRALQELVGLYARMGRLAEAERALARARLRGTDLSAIAARSDIGALRGDARFSALFPNAKTFEKPFVENVRIIHEWRGDGIGDEFGWIGRGIGDVDGDGTTDVVITGTQNPPYGSTHGTVRVYSGRSGTLLWRRDGERGWVLGTSVEAAGDVDRDGVPDVIVGAPGVNVALVLSGRDGREIRRMHGDSTESNFGGAVAGAGDIDGDGYGDVIVGASGASARLSGAGRAIVFSGKSGDRLLTLDGEHENDGFGSAVAGGVGRLLVVGAAAAGAGHQGRVYIFDASSGSTTPRWIEDADSTGVSLGGMFVSIAGDVDGDAVPDVYASDFSNRALGAATGRVYLYSGATGKTLLTLTGESAGEALGTSASRAGDVDGDGRADLAVGSWQFGGAAWSGGKITIYSGRDGHVLRRITGRVPGETLGFDSVGIGDVDGDGRADFLVTSAYSLVHGARSGRAFVVAGERVR